MARRRKVMPINRKDKLLAKALQEIYDFNGTITPDLVVEYAEPELSPIHDRFEWDDGLAAKRYRIEQARTLIRSVRVAIITEEIVGKSPVYARNPSIPIAEQGYLACKTAKESMPSELLEHEIDCLLSYMRRVVGMASTLGFISVSRSLGEIAGQIAQLKANLENENRKAA
jgi:hypothetical protein